MKAAPDKPRQRKLRPLLMPDPHEDARAAIEASAADNPAWWGITLRVSYIGSVLGGHVALLRGVMPMHAYVGASAFAALVMLTLCLERSARNRREIRDGDRAASDPRMTTGGAITTSVVAGLVVAAVIWLMQAVSFRA